jgi:hypothetical protein
MLSTLIVPINPPSLSIGTMMNVRVPPRSATDSCGMAAVLCRLPSFDAARREKFESLPGAPERLNACRAARSNVSSWHESEVPAQLAYVGFRQHSGKHLLAVRFSQFGPLAEPASAGVKSMCMSQYIALNR